MFASTARRKALTQLCGHTSTRRRCSVWKSRCEADARALSTRRTCHVASSTESHSVTQTDENADSSVKGDTVASVKTESPSVKERARSTAYPFAEIEQKWQKYWAQHKTFRTDQQPDTSKPKYYILDMFPYPRSHISITLDPRDLERFVDQWIGFACGASGRLHSDRYLGTVQTRPRLQRPPSNGMGCLWSPC